MQVGKISERQARLINSSARYCLAAGPRKGGKTIGCAHACCKHCFQIPGVRLSVVGNSNTVNADGGSWDDLLLRMDEWVNYGKLEWVTGPKVKGLTKKLFFEVQGPVGKAYIQLDSLHVEAEAEERFKGKRFSMIWVTQIDETIRLKKTFTNFEENLRMDHLMDEEKRTGRNLHRFIADANPAPEGVDSWIYKEFYLFPHQKIPDEDGDGNPLTASQKLGLRERQESMEVIEFPLDENPFLSDSVKRAIWTKYCYDQNLLARYFYGKWVKATGLGFFSEVWRPSFHVWGNCSGRDDLDTYMLPEPDCWELGTGWDLGAKNPAVVFVEPVNIASDPNRPVYLVKVLDELVLLKQTMSLSDFVGLVIEKMDKLEDAVNQQRKIAGKEAINIKWTHVSDSASFSKYDSIADTFEHKAVWQESAGRIEMVACEKGPNSIARQLDLMRRMIHQDRLLVDAHCEMVLQMLSNFRLGKTGRVDRADQNKHALDALRYYVSRLCYTELETKLYTPVKSRGGIVSVPI